VNGREMNFGFDQLIAKNVCLRPQRSPWRFSGRLTGPPWNRSLAEIVEQSAFSDSGHSRASSDGWNKIAAERPHPIVADFRSRPNPEVHVDRFDARNRTLNRP
jgi:hypothetical protein